MNILLQVIQGISLVSSEIVPVEQLIERLKAIFTLNPDAKIAIQNLESEAIEADTETMQMVKDWQAAHGISSASDATSSSAASPVAAPNVNEMPAPAAPAAEKATPSSAASPAVIGEAGDHGKVGDLGTNTPPTAPKA